MPGSDPDRAGFTVALEAARDTVVSLVGATAATGPRSSSVLVGHIGARVLHALLPGRRMRLSTRIVKYGTSRCNSWNRDGRPRDSTPFTTIEITVHPPALPNTRDPGRTPSGRWGQVCQILAANSNEAMHTRDIAQHLRLATAGRPLSSLTAQLFYWARNGQLIRTAPNTYEITLPDALTSSTSP